GGPGRRAAVPQGAPGGPGRDVRALARRRRRVPTRRRARNRHRRDRRRVSGHGLVGARRRAAPHRLAAASPARGGPGAGAPRARRSHQARMHARLCRGRRRAASARLEVLRSGLRARGARPRLRPRQRGRAPRPHAAHASGRRSPRRAGDDRPAGHRWLMAAARFVRVNGLRLWVSVRGEGRPVLLINGLGASLAIWAALQDDLDGLEVISYDAPGTGRSSTPLWPYTMGELARVARGLLDELGHDEVDVVGYSLGGLVAQELALRASERVRRLVLAGTTCGLGAVPGPLSAILAVVTPIRYYSKLA